MNDSNPAPGPSAERRGHAQDGHLVTELLGSDATIMMLARQAVEDGGGSPGAVLAARRDLDRELRAMITWPSGRDYERAATSFEQTGRREDAALLRRIAATDPLLAQARSGWNTRYDTRPPSPVTQMAYRLRGAGLIDFDPAGPYPGADGAAYEPGAFTKAGRTEPILVITGRGGAEFLTGWPGFEAMAAWTATRGTTATGPLTHPQVKGACRCWQEDQILARLITSPRDAPQLTAGLPPGTFTTDVRHDIYQAVLHLAGTGTGYYTPGQVARQVATQIAALPPHALASYGGPGGLFARAYLARLAATEVTAETAAATAATLAAEDQRYRQRPAPARTQAAPAPTGHQPRPVRAPSPGPQLQPPPLPGPCPAPVQGP